MTTQFKIGDQVREKEGRHIGTVERVYIDSFRRCQRVKVRWNDNNFLGYFDDDQIEHAGLTDEEHAYAAFADQSRQDHREDRD